PPPESQPKQIGINSPPPTPPGLPGRGLARNLIGKLKDREVHEVGERLASETGRIFSQSASGEYVTGTYRQRMVLASGRYAMIDDGLQFQLVPWTPSLERQRERHVSGVARGDGGIDWSFTRNRGVGL
ncbi:DUF3363 domain-containing protein, partial [Novacetimonas hansenii]